MQGSEVSRTNETRNPNRQEGKQARGRTCEPTTIYVHLKNGEVVPVPDVTRLQVTDTSVELDQGRGKVTSYPRSNVYYACCDRDMSPPQY